jgi:nucleoside-diphosphate kinase
MGRNVIHGSDSVASAERELKIFFQAEELLSDWSRENDCWVYEACKTPVTA